MRSQVGLFPSHPPPGTRLVAVLWRLRRHVVCINLVHLVGSCAPVFLPLCLVTRLSVLWSSDSRLHPASTPTRWVCPPPRALLLPGSRRYRGKLEFVSGHPLRDGALDGHRICVQKILLRRSFPRDGPSIHRHRDDRRSLPAGRCMHYPLQQDI